MSSQWLQRNKSFHVEVNVRTDVLRAAVSLSFHWEFPGVSVSLAPRAPGFLQRLRLIVPLQYIILDLGENSHEDMKSLSLISLLTFSLCSMLG